jgi:hypothetical protein
MFVWHSVPVSPLDPLLAVFALLAIRTCAGAMPESPNHGSRRKKILTRGYSENVILTNGRLTAGKRR